MSPRLEEPEDNEVPRVFTERQLALRYGIAIFAGGLIGFIIGAVLTYAIAKTVGVS